MMTQTQPIPRRRYLIPGQIAITLILIALLVGIGLWSKQGWHDKWVALIALLFAIFAQAFVTAIYYARKLHRDFPATYTLFEKYLLVGQSWGPEASMSIADGAFKDAYKETAKSFRRVCNIFGWTVFAIMFVVYMMYISSPTTLF